MARGTVTLSATSHLLVSRFLYLRLKCGWPCRFTTWKTEVDWKGLHDNLASNCCTTIHDVILLDSYIRFNYQIVLFRYRFISYMSYSFSKSWDLQILRSPWWTQLMFQVCHVAGIEESTVSSQNWIKVIFIQLNQIGINYDFRGAKATISNSREGGSL